MEETDTRISSEPVADAKVDTVEAPDTDAVQQTTSHLPDAAVSDNTECELAPPSLDSEMRDSTAEAEMGAMEGSNETRGVPVARLEEHDSLVTVRLSEPPIVTLSSASGGTWDSNGTLPGESEPSTTANRSARSTMPTVNEDDAAASEETSEEDEPVNWDQLQQNEDNEASGQNSDNVRLSIFSSYSCAVCLPVRASVLTLRADCYAACPTRTRKRKACNKPQERPRTDPSGRSAVASPSSPAVRSPAPRHGSWPDALCSAILDASSTSNDRSRVLRSPREGLSRDRCPSPDAAFQ